MSKIAVIVGSTDSPPATAVLELLSGARALGDQVEAIVWGGDSQSFAEKLGAFGANRVMEIGDLGDALPAPAVSAALAAYSRTPDGPDAYFIPTNYDGRDIAGRLSVRLDEPILANIVGITREDDRLTTEHGNFGGAKLVRAQFTMPGVGLYLIRSKTFSATPTSMGAAEIVHLHSGEIGTTGAARIIERHVEQRTGPKLDEALVVVSGGRGLESQENYRLIEQLADLLHGAPGATRAIVDSGWVPYAYQVGQTGTTVKPQVYFAIGISGASQHIAGMKSAQNIIAINRDEQAPIFSVADLGIVGNALDILPKLISALQSRR